MRTTYRDAFCRDYGPPRSRAAPPDPPIDPYAAARATALAATTQIKSREFGVTSGTAAPGYALTSYRDAFCTPYLKSTWTQPASRGFGANAPKTQTFGGPGTTVTVPSPSFYSRTSYRDAFGDPLTDGGEFEKTPPPPAPPGETAPPQRARAATASVSNTRSLNFARTTYRDAFGSPMPVTSQPYAGEESRALTRGGALSATEDPRWPFAD
jgi:hypothetical protein